MSQMVGEVADAFLDLIQVPVQSAGRHAQARPAIHQLLQLQACFLDLRVRAIVGAFLQIPELLGETRYAQTYSAGKLLVL